jgi:hypothetical protein
VIVEKAASPDSSIVLVFQRRPREGHGFVAMAAVVDEGASPGGAA